MLSRCWGYLAKEHALKAGDVCVFELTNTEDYTLKLSAAPVKYIISYLQGFEYISFYSIQFELLFCTLLK